MSIASRSGKGCSSRLFISGRAGVRTVLLPRGNEKDLGEVPEEVRADLEFVILETMDEVLEHALERAAPPAAATATPIPPVEPTDPPPGQYAH